jgi:hypothetical protein
MVKMNQRSISSNSIPSYEIPSVILHLLDGSISTMITRAANITIRFTTNDILRLKFYITKLDSTSAFVFGHNWLHCYNPLIDWSAGQIDYFRNLPHSVPSSAHTGITNSSELPVSRPSASVLLLSVPSDDASTSSTSAPPGDSSSLPSVSFINAATYVRLARVKGNTIFTVTVSNSDSATGFSANTDPVDLPSILEEYHEFADVFSKSQASMLPPH